MTTARFSLSEQLTPGFIKLGGRRLFNLGLDDLAAYDDALFARQLEAALGLRFLDGERFIERVFIDHVTGTNFSVYSAQSGPAYGGSPALCLVDFSQGDNRLRPEVRACLQAFEQWLSGAEGPDPHSPKSGAST